MKEWSFSQNWYQFLIMAVVCYLIGCFNFAKLIARFKHKDITKIGSGNPGTMNMSREFGLKVGIITFFCDAFKGGIPALITYFVYRSYYFSGTNVVVSDFTRYFCGACVIIGHIFPITMKFHGGKGIASTLGLFWINLGCENPWFLLVGFAAFWLIAFYIAGTEWGSMGSLIGVSGLGLWQGVIVWLRYRTEINNPYVIALFMLVLLINFLTWFAHRKNILRLLSGEEHRTSVKKMLHKKKKA